MFDLNKKKEGFYEKEGGSIFYSSDAGDDGSRMWQ